MIEAELVLDLPPRPLDDFSVSGDDAQRRRQVGRPQQAVVKELQHVQDARSAVTYNLM